MRAKKGQGQMWWVIISAIILIIVAVVVISINTGLLGKTAGKVGVQIEATGDEDGDTIINQFDRCPCNYGDVAYDGCVSEEAKQPTEGYRKNIAGCSEDIKKGYSK